jgi:hypothetical protein
MDMISAVCGPGAIKAVQEKVRSSIEFQFKVAMAKRDSDKKELAETNTRARQIFNEITDMINLRCPRCQMVFHDYDGCNALQCASHKCKAAFCAICLEDCGSDAHNHVIENHGDLFDKQAFSRSKASRSRLILEDKLATISHESPELGQLVKNHVERAGLLSTGGKSSCQDKTTSFLKNARESLRNTIKNDRLGILSNPDEYRPGTRAARITRSEVSPRSLIPENFRVTMTCTGLDLYRISLEQNIIEDRWVHISLKEAEKELKDHPHAANVQNLVQNVQTAVIAISGMSSLIQTRVISTRNNEKCKQDTPQEDNIRVSLACINQRGELEEGRFQMQGAVSIVGINSNIRMIKLENHVKNACDSDLMFPSLKHLVGDGHPTPCLSEILRPVPDILQGLNREQKKVAHPLKLRSTMEVAGPPGTGKTKTITALVDTLMECTDFDVFVLSERNGAINAIAEKFKDVSLDISSKRTKVIDPRIWMSVLTYGAGDTIGDSTKMFTLDEKLR